MTKQKLSSRPPLKVSQEDALRDFITKPLTVYKTEETPSKNHPSQKEILPWERPSVREDVTKLFNLRLNEPLALKLEYLSKIKRVSKHQICIEIIEKKINEMIEGHS